MSPEDLLVAQAEMRKRLRNQKKARKTRVRRRYVRPEPPPVDLSSLPTKVENGQTITICPPAYDRKLEYDANPKRYYSGSSLDRDDYDIEEERWQPSRSAYKALCNAANAGSYLVQDNDTAEYTQTGLRLARELVKVIQKCIRKNRPFPPAWQELLGCDLEYFQEYIEKLFKPGMNWSNWGEWHLDHIKPLVAFSLDFRPELLSACNYRNLQPLWAFDNSSKGGRYDG